jgi:hypothetical protein
VTIGVNSLARPTKRDCRNAAIAAIIMCAMTVPWIVRTSSLAELAKGLAFAVPFLSAPFMILAIASRFAEKRVTRIVHILAIAAALLWWLYAFATTFVFNSQPDAQDGLIVLVAPVIASAAILVIVCVAALFDRRD